MSAPGDTLRFRFFTLNGSLQIAVADAVPLVVLYGENAAGTRVWETATVAAINSGEYSVFVVVPAAWENGWTCQFRTDYDVSAVPFQMLGTPFVLDASAASLGADIYDAEHDVARGDTIDGHHIQWFKNSSPIGVVPTDPQFRIIKEDGTELFTWTNMVVAAPNNFLYDAVGIQRIIVGEPYSVERRAMIDGVLRTHIGLISRDKGSGIGVLTVNYTSDSIPVQTDLDLVTGYVICLSDDNLPLAGAEVHFRMVEGDETDGFALSGNEITITSGIDGVAFHSFIRGASYQFRYGDSNKWRIYKAPELGTGNWLIGQFIGKP